MRTASNPKPVAESRPLEAVIKNIEFLGIWEHLNNPVFKPVEFDGFRIQAGLNSFTLTPKQWIEKTGAIGIISNLRNSLFRNYPKMRNGPLHN